MNRLALMSCLLAALAVVACTEEAAAPSPDPAGRPAPPSVDAPVDEVPPPAPDEDLPAFTTGDSSADVASTGPGAPILRAVRTGTHAGFDRIVFEFDSDALPQWHVAYLDGPVIQCGSGDTMAIEGIARLQVRFNGANAHTEAGEATSGPMRRSPALPALRELVRTCDFEAEVTWVAGTATRQGYRPRVLDDPARLVIDIAH